MRAPCDPPVTSNTGRSGRSPKWERALSPTASLSRPAISRLIGMPMYVAFLSTASGWPVKTCVVNLAPILLARPGLGLASCTTIGTLRRLAAR